MKTITVNQVGQLTLVNNFGYLTTRELAILAFPNYSAEAGLKLAQRAVMRLKTAGLVLARALPFDGQTNAYVLTRAGADVLSDHHMALWFAHGYDLSMNDLHARRPLIVLLGNLAGNMMLEPVGSRGIGKDYRELGRLKAYDAVLVDSDGMPVFGLVTIQGYNAAAQKRVVSLSGQALPFLIATTNAPRLDRFISARAKASPAMAAEIVALLPPGVVA
jgi:hypothetical protein